MEKIKDLIQQYRPKLNFDSIAVGVLSWASFSSPQIEVVEYQDARGWSSSPYLYFDLSSLTKPLTLFPIYNRYFDLFDKDDHLYWLLEHRAGCPSGGRLGHSNWKELVMNYPLKYSPTLYSDFGFLRLMLELEKKLTTSFRELIPSKVFELAPYWKDLPKRENLDFSLFPITGFRNKKPIQGEVHDDNAFIIGELTSHAGQFARIDQLCLLLFDFIVQNVEERINKRLNEIPPDQRFVLGFDRVQNLKETLAGEGASLQTFGHLGFTGTSFWLDFLKKRGYILLTNATQNCWYERRCLNYLRRMVGSAIWKNL